MTAPDTSSWMCWRFFVRRHRRQVVTRRSCRGGNSGAIAICRVEGRVQRCLQATTFGCWHSSVRMAGARSRGSLKRWLRDRNTSCSSATMSAVLGESVAEFFREGLIAGEPIVMIATEAHRRDVMPHASRRAASMWFRRLRPISCGCWTPARRWPASWSAVRRIGIAFGPASAASSHAAGHFTPAGASALTARWSTCSGRDGNRDDALLLEER